MMFELVIIALFCTPVECKAEYINVTPYEDYAACVWERSKINQKAIQAEDGATIIMLCRDESID